MFAVIDKFHFSFAEFVAALCDIAEVPSLKKIFALRQLERQLYYSRTYDGGIVRCLGLEDYKPGDQAVRPF